MDINSEKLKTRIDAWIAESIIQNIQKLSFKDISDNLHLLIDQQVEEEQEEMARGIKEQHEGDNPDSCDICKNNKKQ